MTEFVHLVGAEDVSRAGSRMQEAAQIMKHAADEIDHAMRQHQQFLENWLQKFEQIVTDNRGT